MTVAHRRHYEPEAARLQMPPDVEAAWELAYDKGWTDGLPIIPPTLERVEAMLAGTSLSPSTVVADLDPRRAPASVEKIAINAVMAGCRPEYMPVLLAAVRAMSHPEYDLHGLATTTHPVAPMTVINGPIRERIGVNSGRNALGPGVRANATIGRAVRLIMINIAGGIPQEADKAILGLSAKYTCCLGEDEEGSPWDPLHVERGLDRGDSAVTMFGAGSQINVLIICPPENALKTQLDRVANALSLTGSNPLLRGRGEVLVIVPRGWAQLLAEGGYSKDDVKQYLWEHGSIPEEACPPGIPMANPILIDGRLHITRSPDAISIIVAGGPEPYHVMVCPSYGERSAMERVTDEG